MTAQDLIIEAKTGIIILVGIFEGECMKQAGSIAIIMITGFALVGCQPEGVAYQYRAGSQYEYKQLMDAWIPNNDTLPPLPPTSEGSESEWVSVPVAAEPVSSASYHPRPKMYIGASYGWGESFGRRHHNRSYWRGRRHYRGSGLSVGFSFGSAPHSPGWGRYGYWDDWNCDWPNTGAYGPRHFRW
jgi:hypothetical protein